MSGIALRPAWGPMYGKQAVSEQALSEEIIDRFPAGSISVMDRNFGVFSVAWYAHAKGHPIVVRMTDSRARALPGGKLPQQTDQWIDWKPSRWDRKAHLDLPAGACLRVRLIATQVLRKGKVVQLYVLTTLELPVDQIVELYGFRWNIELDLRSLKQTMDLHSLRSTTPGMAAKELVLAVTAYNFVRAAIYAASPGGESKPAPNQFLASPGCGQRVPAQSAGGSLGTRTCPSIGRHASPYCPMQTSPNQPSAELPQNGLAPQRSIPKTQTW